MGKKSDDLGIVVGVFRGVWSPGSAYNAVGNLEFSEEVEAFRLLSPVRTGRCVYMLLTMKSLSYVSIVRFHGCCWEGELFPSR